MDSNQVEDITCWTCGRVIKNVSKAVLMMRCSTCGSVLVLRGSETLTRSFSEIKEGRLEK